MSSSLTCPVCGSEEITKVENSIKINEPFADELTVQTPWYRCETCSSDGDFFGENDLIIRAAKEAALIEGVKNILDDIRSANVSFASVERALGLAQRTLTKWHSSVSKPSAAAVALLRMIGTFPWLLQVGDSKYDHRTSTEIFLANAVHRFLEVAPVSSVVSSMNVSSSGAAFMTFSLVAPRIEDMGVPYKEVATNRPVAQIEVR